VCREKDHKGYEILNGKRKSKKQSEKSVSGKGNALINYYEDRVRLFATKPIQPDADNVDDGSEKTNPGFVDRTIGDNLLWISGQLEKSKGKIKVVSFGEKHIIRLFNVAISLYTKRNRYPEQKILFKLTNEKGIYAGLLDLETSWRFVFKTKENTKEE
jgi:hypothetical protein